MKEKSCNANKTSIGGQALIEGIMMRGPKMTAMAVRNPEGQIVLEKWETQTSARQKIFKLPVIRGIFNYIDSMRFGYKCLMRSAEIAVPDEEEPKKKKKSEAEVETENPESTTETAETVDASVAADAMERKTDENASAAKNEKKESSGFWMNLVMVISVVLGFVLALGLFVALPSFLYSLLAKYVPFLDEDNRYVKSIFEGLLKVIILVVYLAAVSLMKDIRRTFMYHGAEHKTIFCYEAGLELTVENIRLQRRFHPRCGTSFLILMVLVSIVVSLFIPIGIPTALRVLIKLALIPVIVGIGYELLKFAGRHDNIVTKIISAPGVWLQHITVFEPDDSMIECAIAAMKEVVPSDGSDKW